MMYIQITDGYVTDAIATPYDGYILAENVPDDVMCGCYRYENGEFIRDEKRYAEYLDATVQFEPMSLELNDENILQIIRDLRKMLADSDYKVIKCAEYQLVGLEPPYDIQALHAERQVLRDNINLLEGSE